MRTCEAAALAFCRLLDGWARGEPQPCTAGRRQAALRRAAERAETALAGLEQPLDRYLLELESEIAEGQPWYGQPGPAELVEWEPVLRRAGVAVAPHRVAQAYLELAVLVRALEGLTTSVRFESRPDRASLWAGLFDLRENLFGAVGRPSRARRLARRDLPRQEAARGRRTALHGAGEACVSCAPEDELPRGCAARASRCLRQRRASITSSRASFSSPSPSSLRSSSGSDGTAASSEAAWCQSLDVLFGGASTLIPLALGALGGLLLARSSLPDVRPFRTGLIVLTLAVLLAFGSGQFGLGPDAPPPASPDLDTVDEYGGVFGAILFIALDKLLGGAGVTIVTVLGIVAGVVLLTGASLGAALRHSARAGGHIARHTARAARRSVERVQSVPDSFAPVENATASGRRRRGVRGRPRGSCGRLHRSRPAADRPAPAGGGSRRRAGRPVDGGAAGRTSGRRRLPSRSLAGIRSTGCRIVGS